MDKMGIYLFLGQEYCVNRNLRENGVKGVILVILTVKK